MITKGRMAPVRIQLSKEGSLEKYGYHISDTRPARRAALKKVFADRKSRKGLNQLIARINVLSIYFKKSNPLYAARANEDESFVRKYRDEKFPAE
ncbi:hypothetical protein ATCVMN08101_617R [Acanthocystis turfacea Chlorella virus MN0810.1]|nr:hypothetical protein ATCVMN08101_617R [Acanthocystis turfacea Chlorella virus MN0810.1]